MKKQLPPQLNDKGEEEKLNSKTSITKLSLTSRAENCLLGEGINTLEKLINTPIPKLLEIKNLGGKSLEEVVVKIKEFKEQNPYSKEWQNIYWGVKVSDQGMKTTLGNIIINYPIDFLPIEELIILLKRKGVKNIKELLKLDEWESFLNYKGRIFDRLYKYNHKLMEQTAGAAYYEKILTYNQLPVALDFIREKIVAVDSRTWTENIFKGLSSREMEIIQKYYGLKGARLTLQEIGDQYGLTRARIQQIVKKIKNKVLGNIYFENLIILMWFHTFGLLQGGVFLQEIFQKEFNTYYKDLSIDNNGLSEMLLDIDPMFQSLTYNVWGMTVLPIEHYQKIIEEGVQILQKGPLDEKNLLKELKQRPLYYSIKSRQEYVTGVLDNFIPACLASAQNLALNPMGNYTLEEKEGTKIQSIINVLREEGKPLHYHEILKRVNSKGGNITVQYARAILANHKEIFARVGRGIYGLVEWGIKEYKHISDYIFDILTKADKPLYYKEICKIVNTTHYTKHQTIYNALTQDARFKRTKTGYYTINKS
ncbi:Sigma-70, region 4 [Anaerobranca californiensis DSM 14826]|uniref:Sigma-70, region 4 n=1 Tax=Anaerobranca californiensis DSM 14826 TaxID=1120989 RepID=A0A1M6P6Q2_9FIRM|nr:winged helix-turn-helix domain-containing protein [Anaerobranca californiensis]SHK03595.1 Sigma-70, region 4 [Anaerobranca californiensis DSM 14826]